jgi:hypothetical protein
VIAVPGSWLAAGAGADTAAITIRAIGIAMIDIRVRLKADPTDEERMTISSRFRS